MSKQVSFKQVLLIIFMSICFIVVVIPFVWLLSSTFKTNAEIVSGNQTFFPSNFTFENYYKIFKEFNIGRYFANSMYLSIIRTLIGVYTSLLCGYVLAKYTFKLNKIFYGFVLVSMMVPGFSTLIPIYEIMNKYGLNDSYTAIILPTSLSTFGIFMMKQYIHSGVPNELLEAARIDGASEFFIFHKIVAPLCVNMISALSIFLFLWNWEDFLFPYLILTTDSKFPLAVALSTFSGKNSVAYGQLFAATAVTMIPILIVYFIFQKRFVEGMSMNGIK